MTIAELRAVIVGLLLLGLIIGGCDLSGSGVSSPSLSIETDRGAYHLARDSTIQVEIRNVSDQPIHYSTCLATSLEVVEDGQVVDTIGLPVCYCACPATLEPGEKVAPTVSSVSMDAIAQVSDRLGESSVSYRLAYAFYQDEPWGDLLARPERQSNPFDLQLP